MIWVFLLQRVPDPIFERLEHSLFLFLFSMLCITFFTFLFFITSNNLLSFEKLHFCVIYNILIIIVFFFSSSQTFHRFDWFCYCYLHLNHFEQTLDLNKFNWNWKLHFNQNIKLFNWFDIIFIIRKLFTVDDIILLQFVSFLFCFILSGYSILSKQY